MVVAGVFDSPWKNPILAGFQLSPIFSYHSGHPFNLLAGTEVNGNNHTTNERPIGANRDTGLGPEFHRLSYALELDAQAGRKSFHETDGGRIQYRQPYELRQRE